METLWCVLRKYTTSVDTARVRRRPKKYYENTEVEISRKPRGCRYKLVDIDLRCRYSGVGRRYKRLGLKCSVVSVGISVLVAQENHGRGYSGPEGQSKRGRSTGEHGYASERRKDMWRSSMRGQTLV